jgi:hypothetical protein
MQPITGSKHVAPGQWQTITWWLELGAQPHAPVVHELGKSLAEAQQSDMPMVPPVPVQSAAGPEPASVAANASVPESTGGAASIDAASIDAASTEAASTEAASTEAASFAAGPESVPDVPPQPATTERESASESESEVRGMARA